MLTKKQDLLIKILLALFSPVVLLAVLEAGAYLLAVEPLAASREYMYHLDYRNHQYGYDHPRQDCNPKAVARPGKKTILTLGGSSVQGFIPNPARVPFFPLRLHRMLNQTHPGQYAVVNRGRVTKNSTFVRKCVENAIDAKPEFLVVYSGHNDYTSWGMKNPRRAMFLEEHAWIYDVQRLLSYSRGFAASARLVLPAAVEVPRLAEVSDEQYAAARPVILDKYISNISSIIRLAGRRGAQVILVTVVSNLYDFPLRGDDWIALPMQVVSNLYDFPLRGDDWIALPMQARDTDRLRRWEAHFTRGRELVAAGRFNDALVEFKKARDERGLGRALSEINNAVRRLSRTAPHVHLVDIEKLLDDIGKEEEIGCNFFGDDKYCDQFHPNARTHQLIAEALFRKLQALLEERA